MIDFYVTYLRPANVYESSEYTWVCGHVSFELSCVHVEHLYPMCIFSLKWDGSKCCRGNRRHFMAWINISVSQTFGYKVSHNVIHIHGHVSTKLFSSHFLSDDLSDYTDDNHLQEASLHLLQVRQRLRAVITYLKLRLTIQMIQLARFFRNHFRQRYNIPIVNLDFQWLL